VGGLQRVGQSGVLQSALLRSMCVLGSLWHSGGSMSQCVYECDSELPGTGGGRALLVGL
jgi:hypothetical protein